MGTADRLIQTAAPCRWVLRGLAIHDVRDGKSAAYLEEPWRYEQIAGASNSITLDDPIG
jgi:hypothetical protein